MYLLIATDATLPVEEGNPLRQVIINTHSPAVVAQVPDDSLQIAELRETIRDKLAGCPIHGGQQISL
ncbi:MAG: hypothetical protein H7843_14925 [Nitrospirota bacterium]